MSIDLRLGDWRSALADVGQVDCLITDPPYSARTHAGMQMGAGQYVDAKTGGLWTRKGVAYGAWSDADMESFIAAWAPRVRSWFVMLTDHILAPAAHALLEQAGRCAFAPLPFVEMGKQPRLSGDGPASWTCWIVVARPRQRRFQSWGSLPGAYVPPAAEGGTANTNRIIKGGKPLWLMRALVRDYSRPGDLVCDPCAGGATTLLAAAIEGRRAIGSELDPATHAKALARIARGYTPNMFAQHEAAAEQLPMFEAGEK